MSNHVVRDQVSDTNGAELKRLSKLYPFPDFVKKANMDDTMRPQRLLPTVYADPRPANRAYPCHSAAATWLSNLYFQDKQAEYHPKDRERIQRNLDKFASYWGIKAACDKIKELAASLTKTADDQLPDSAFGYVWAGDDGHKQRHLRMVNATEVKVAAEWLHRHRDRLPFDDRHKIAGKIREKAARFGADLGGYDAFIEKQAGYGVCNPERVATMLRNRAKIAKFAEHKQAIEKLASMVEAKPRAALVPDQLVKLARTVDDIDRALNLVGRYTETVPRPEDVIFEATYKEVEAAHGQVFAMTTGTVYDKGDLDKLALDDVKAMFGNDFASEVASGFNVDPEKTAELAATLPRGDAELFDRLLTESGIRPIQTKTASAGVGFDAETMEAVGGGY